METIKRPTNADNLRVIAARTAEQRPPKKTRHASITLDRIVELVELDDNLGICGACGQEAYGVEPDARKYPCESCGENRVHGAEEWLLLTQA